jgi:hypothetical protein
VPYFAKDVNEKMKNMQVWLFLVLIVSYEAMVVFDYYNHIKKCGFEPVGVLDVGANRGEWTKANQAIFPNADYLMIEGNRCSFRLEKFRILLKQK